MEQSAIIKIAYHVGKIMNKRRLKKLKQLEKDEKNRGKFGYNKGS